jgi:hypothetical protein
MDIEAIKLVIIPGNMYHVSWEELLTLYPWPFPIPLTELMVEVSWKAAHYAI